MRLPRRPQAVVFDLDGTLIDSEALVKEAHFAACALMGYTMSEAQFLALVGMHREANDLQLRSYYGDDFPLDDFIANTRAHVGDRVAPLKPGALELMDVLDELALPFAWQSRASKQFARRRQHRYNMSKTVPKNASYCINKHHIYAEASERIIFMF